jgi:serine/threonine protein kinase
MAPEVVLRRPYSCQVDMWVLGVIAYILLSGSMPFEDNSRPRLKGRYSFHGEVREVLPHPQPAMHKHTFCNSDFTHCLSFTVFHCHTLFF